jgi:hypothetical protein
MVSGKSAGERLPIDASFRPECERGSWDPLLISGDRKFTLVVYPLRILSVRRLPHPSPRRLHPRCHPAVYATGPVLI